MILLSIVFGMQGRSKQAILTARKVIEQFPAYNNLNQQEKLVKVGEELTSTLDQEHSLGSGVGLAYTVLAYLLINEVDRKNFKEETANMNTADFGNDSTIDLDLNYNP
jgi:hypothetical protein